MLKLAQCPTCKEITIVIVSHPDPGWVRWKCVRNGCIREWQVTGRVN